MTETDDRNEEGGVERRRLLAGLGAAAATGLAGCSMLGGDGGDGGGGPSGGSPGELGERVPTIQMHYGANVKAWELVQSQMGKHIQDALGVQTEVKPIEFTTHYGNIISDERVSSLPMYYQFPSPNRFDPHPTLIQYSIENAGATPKTNLSQYTNCKFSRLAHEQARETDEEKRREMVYEAFAMLNEKIAFLPSGGATLIQAVRTDEIDVRNVEDRYLTSSNPLSIVNSEAKNDENTMIFETGPSTMATRNYPTKTSFAEMSIWNHLIHSPLVEYDDTLEKFNALADSIEYGNEGKRVIVSLKDGTFHNGDPITSEDVKFTYEQITRAQGTYPKAPSVPLDSIETVDEKTVEFNLSRVHIPFVSKDLPLWGIMHKQTWVDGGAVENPGEFTFEPTIGSGPYELTSFQRSQAMRLEPHDGHPVFDANSNIVYQAFRNANTSVQALKAGEIHEAGLGANPDLAKPLEGEDAITILPMPTTTNLFDAFQLNISPSKFKAFRRACGQSINHPKILELYSPKYGHTNPWGLPITEKHPWHPPTDMLQEIVPRDGPKPEKARQILREAGWGWDDDGNLHYPPDADLSPAWPKGETPDPSEFPCLSENGSYVPPGGSAPTATATPTETPIAFESLDEAVTGTNEIIDRLNNGDPSISTINAATEDYDSVSKMALVEPVEAANAEEASAESDRLLDEADRVSTEAVTTAVAVINAAAGFEFVPPDTKTAEAARKQAAAVEGASQRAADFLRDGATVAEVASNKLAPAAEALGQV